MVAGDEVGVVTTDEEVAIGASTLYCVVDAPMAFVSGEVVDAEGLIGEDGVDVGVAGIMDAGGGTVGATGVADVGCGTAGTMGIIGAGCDTGGTTEIVDADGVITLGIFAGSADFGIEELTTIFSCFASLIERTGALFFAVVVFFCAVFFGTLFSGAISAVAALFCAAPLIAFTSITSSCEPCVERMFAINDWAPPLTYTIMLSAPRIPNEMNVYFIMLASHTKLLRPSISAEASGDWAERVQEVLPTQ